MYKLFLCLRYLRRRRIAFFAVAAVCLCVAMVLIVLSVMDGFLQMVRDRSRGLLGDLVMENGALQGFPYYEDFIDELMDDPQIGPRIHQATPVIISYGVVRFPRTQITKAVQIVGIRLHETYEVNDFKQGLFYEKYYPGTTSLASQPAPGTGYDEDGNLLLPPELEAAWQKWKQSASAEELAEVPVEEDLIPSDMTFDKPGLYAPVPVDERDDPMSPDPGWFGRELYGIILGTDVCARRNREGGYDRYYWRGEPVQLTMVPMTDTGRIPDATGMPSRAFRYVDDCRTGVYDIDSMSVYVDFDVLQEILEMNDRHWEETLEDGEVIKHPIPARTTQVQIKLEPDAHPIRTRDLIVERWNVFAAARVDKVRAPRLLLDVEIKTWEEKQAKFIAAVEKEKYLVTVLFAIISVVAVFLVGCIFYMIVQEKTRDIGIVKSVGATSFGVAQIFLAYGAAVGIVGGALGTVLGAVFVRYINDIQDLLTRINPEAQIWNPEVYTFDRIPNEVEPVNAIAIYAIAIVASMVGSLIAAFRAARVWPVESLRYE